MHLLGTIVIISLLIVFMQTHSTIAAIIFFGAIALCVKSWMDSIKEARQRQENITRYYGDSDIAQRLISQTPWISQTRDQLVESFGAPHESEFKQTAKHQKEIWKFYYPNTKRIKLKITLTDGQVSHIDSR